MRGNIILDKNVSQINDELKIKIIGLISNKVYRLELSTTDYYAINTSIKDAPVGSLWRSTAEFLADDDGIISLDNQSPVRGSYNYIDSLGLFTHLSLQQKINKPLVSNIKKLPMYNSCTFVLKVYDGDEVVAEKEIVRQFCDDSITVEDFDFGKMQVRFFKKIGMSKMPAMIILSGSDGRIEKAQAIAECFAANGYAAIAVGYFGMQGMSRELVEVPMDCLEKIIKWTVSRDDIDADRIGIYGRSKGGEMALLAASMFPQIHKAVVVMGSCYVYAGLKSKYPAFSKSSWSYNGKDIYCLRYGIKSSIKMLYRSKFKNDKFALQKLAHDSFVNCKNASKAMIPLEKINGDILFITSEEDTVWPSKEYGEQAIKYIEKFNFKHKIKVLNYSGAGHMITIPNQSLCDLDKFGGGEREECISAAREVWKEIMSFLII